MDDSSTPLLRGTAGRRNVKDARTYSGMHLKDDAIAEMEASGRAADAIAGYGVEQDVLGEWFHGSISSRAAERRLAANGNEDGMFLVRKRGAEHVLTVCGGSKISNFLVKNKRGGYSIGEDAPLFYSLREMVDYFHDYQGGLPCVLRTPCKPSSRSSSTDAISFNDNTDTESENESFADLSSDGGVVKKKNKARLTPAQKLERKKLLKHRREQQLQEQLLSLPAHRPYFVRGVALVMLIVLIIELSTAGGKDGILPVRFQGQLKQESIESGISGSPITISYDEEANPFVGPSMEFLIHMGAKYGLCMRQDDNYLTQRAISIETEQNQLYGCCVLLNINSCGMASQSDCENNPSGGNWHEACCYYSGRCNVTREEYCDKTGGTWATGDGSQDCTTAQCLGEICGSGAEGTSAKQWWRFIVPIFLHAGIIHYMGTMVLQLSLGAQIERTAGSLRMALIYMISGIGGYVTSAVFSPNFPSVGPSGALFGLIGVSVVDLFQSWQIVKEYIDNWAHVGGFFFGILAAVIFLPYLTFGVVDSLRKRCFLLICIPVIVAAFFVMFMVFYVIQETQAFCPGCKYIQCYPYTTDFCKNVPGWSDSEYIPPS